MGCISYDTLSTKACVSHHTDPNRAYRGECWPPGKTLKVSSINVCHVWREIFAYRGRMLTGKTFRVFYSFPSTILISSSLNPYYYPHSGTTHRPAYQWCDRLLRSYHPWRSPKGTLDHFLFLRRATLTAHAVLGGLISRCGISPAHCFGLSGEYRGTLISCSSMPGESHSLFLELFHFDFSCIMIVA